MSMWVKDECDDEELLIRLISTWGIPTDQIKQVLNALYEEDYIVVKPEKDARHIYREVYTGEWLVDMFDAQEKVGPRKG